jgi:hypothetical protein
MNPTIVSGAVATLTDLGRDEGWLQGWLREEPSRLGLGQLTVDAQPPESPADGTFLASEADRCFSVDVQLGELDPTHGFGVLDAWARNRARLPEKDHVAVLVTESCGERYRTTLETLTQHLPLVVIELSVWRGETEALVIPHVALASGGVELAGAPASAAAGALRRIKAAVAESQSASGSTVGEVKTDQKAAAKSDMKSQESAQADASEPPANKDDTGVADPWGLPRKEPEAAAPSSPANGSRLLTKFTT